MQAVCALAGVLGDVQLRQALAPVFGWNLAPLHCEHENAPAPALAYPAGPACRQCIPSADLSANLVSNLGGSTSRSRHDKYHAAPFQHMILTEIKMSNEASIFARLLHTSQW